MKAAIRIEPSPLYGDSYLRYLKVRPSIKNKIKTFIEYKCQVPPLSLGAHDYALSGDLAGFMHCHLSGNILLVYVLDHSVLKLIMVCNHDELYKISTKIKKYANR